MVNFFKACFVPTPLCWNTPVPLLPCLYNWSTIDKFLTSSNISMFWTDAELPSNVTKNSIEVGEGNLQCIALHQDGLFVGGEDGVLRCLDVNSSTVQVVDTFLIGAPITSLDWSLFYNLLAIGSSKVTVYMSSMPIKVYLNFKPVQARGLHLSCW